MPFSQTQVDMMLRRARGTPNGDAWITTFADLAALLLTFFVLTFSMSVIEPIGQGHEGSSGTNILQLIAGPAFPNSNLTSPSDVRVNQSRSYQLAILRQELSRSALGQNHQIEIEKNAVIVKSPGEPAIDNINIAVDLIVEILEELKLIDDYSLSIKSETTNNHDNMIWLGGQNRKFIDRKNIHRLSVVYRSDTPRYVIEIVYDDSQ